MKRVLDVGQCQMDHGALGRLIEKHFDARLVQAHDVAGAIGQLRQDVFDLVLVNRQLDLDGSDGLALIEAIKADPQLAAVPVMLISNYPQAQEAAEKAGAEPGFGKAQLHEPQTLERLGLFLGKPVGAR